jgi:hypothetical protein
MVAGKATAMVAGKATATGAGKAMVAILVLHVTITQARLHERINEHERTSAAPAAPLPTGWTDAGVWPLTVCLLLAG